MIFSSGGLRFGADADQVDSLGPFDRDDPPLHAVPLHCVVGIGDSTAACLSPETCVVRRGGNVCTFIMESPEDLVVVETRLLHPLPLLVESFAKERGIWAALPWKTGILLVLDLVRLASIRNLWHPLGDIS
ncbi:MAG: hypothetical protein VB050_05060 [Geobacteraceae bacterium]|nr:hypothetical protein [Geobacteraceae bacterium]